MSTEYGIFEDGELIETGFHGDVGQVAARATVAALVAAEPDLYFEVCVIDGTQPTKHVMGAERSADKPSPEPVNSDTVAKAINDARLTEAGRDFLIGALTSRVPEAVNEALALLRRSVDERGHAGRYFMDA